MASNSDAMMSLQSTHDISEKENSFALAIAVMRDRLQRLNSDEKNDLYQLLPFLLGDDEEERLSAQVAVREIFDQQPGKLLREVLPETPGEALKNWLTYVSTKIKAARTQAGLTQDQLAAKSGLPQSHICKLETGLHSPTAKTLEKIATALGLSASYFDPSA
ncbi:MAG: helix-turn-helix transcriptional regulator [Planctomycetaceae bacterium]|nr:helix-turn-helix transcriptional regulator [Planctomycetaceae bacterium]